MGACRMENALMYPRFPLASLRPKVHGDDFLGHSITTPVDQDLVNVNFWRHREGSFRLNDFNIAVIPLARLCYLDGRSVFGNSMFRLLNMKREPISHTNDHCDLPGCDLRGWDTSTCDSKAARRLKEGQGSPDASAGDNNRRK